MYEFTKRAELALEYAKNYAKANNYTYVGTEHILYGLLKEGRGLACKILRNQRLKLDYLEKQINLIDGKMQNSLGVESELTPRAKRVVENSVKEAINLKKNYVGTEHILLSLIKETDSVAVRILIDASVDPEKIMLELAKAVSYEEDLNCGGIGRISTTPTLDMYSKNLTYLAATGKLDPVILRENEITGVIEILCRRTKNNPLIIGEAGVGKTAIIEGLCQRIALSQVPETLLNVRVALLDITSMIAGAKYRGDFEERFKSLLTETKNAGNVILVIEELQNIIGAGAAEGAIDATNILKPFLTRGEIQVIATVNFEEYKKHIVKDQALDRRFQQLVVEEPTYNETLEILKGIKQKYEKYHNIKITDKVIELAVRYSIRYLNNRYLPDKAIDLIDEACSKAKLKSQLQTRQNLKNEKEKLLNNKDIKGLKKVQKIELNSKRSKNKISLKSEDICNVISKWCKIPLSKLETSETDKYINVETNLKKKVIGQDMAISVVSKAILRSRLGLKDVRRPIGTFLFVGPTGVGKTELVKRLAEELFFSESNMIRLDMSEYSEKQSTAKLIGAPPGYIGYEGGGFLTEQIIKKPYSIILFDEIEKAHPDVYNILLQIMEDGRLTDSLGRTADFRNTICIMTSNVGARKITDKYNIGFATSFHEEQSYNTLKLDISRELKNTFSPEFLNRLDEIVVFKPLDKDSIKQICKLMLDDVSHRVKEQGYNLFFKEDVIEYITKIGYDQKYGARPIRRVIQNEVENKFADFIINKKVKKNNDIILDYKESEKEISIVSEKK